MLHLATQRTAVVGILSLLLIIVLPLFLSEKVEAAGLQQAYVRLDRLKAATATTGLVCAKPQTVASEAFVTVTFPALFTLGLAATFTVNTSNIPVGSTIWPGIGTATNVTGQVATFPSTDLVVGTLYCFNWINSAAVLTGTSGGSQTGIITTRTSVPADIDSSSYSIAIVANDQIGITATVPPTFTFSLPTNTLTFLSNLTTTPVLTGTSVATVATNAVSGWVVWVKSANAALLSASTSSSISSPGSATDSTVTDVAATNGYFLDVAWTDSGTGTGTVTQAADYGQEYNGDATHGGTLSTTFQPVAASSGTTDGDTVTFTALAKISAIQAAATDYADTLTVVAAGRF